MRSIPRPAPGDVDPIYVDYVARLPGDDVVALLAAQADEVEARLATVSEERALSRYAPGKWSVKQVLGHVIDNERVFAYRALRFARGDTIALPGFDEGLYGRTGGFDARPTASLVEEFRAVRAGTSALFCHLPHESFARAGVASDRRSTVGGYAWVIAGHVRHHLEVLANRYGV